MGGLTAMTKTRVGMMKMILKCVLSVGEQVLKDGVLNVVLTCRERAEQSVHPTGAGVGNFWTSAIRPCG